MTQRANVNAVDLLQNREYSWNIFFFRRSFWVFLDLFRRNKQKIFKIDQEKHKIEKIHIWNPMTTGLIICRETFQARRGSGKDGGSCRKTSLGCNPPFLN